MTESFGGYKNMKKFFIAVFVLFVSISSVFAVTAEDYRATAYKGDADAQYGLGWCYAKGMGVAQNYFEAVKWFRKSAAQGNADAQCYLGYCYENGFGVEKDLFEAVNWYRKSAAQDNAIGQYNLGICYENGNGVEKDLFEAVRYYRMAAKQGYKDAKKRLNDLGETW